MSERLTALQKELQKAGNIRKAKQLQGYFKTGPGEYGHGDIFIGITVPNLRSIAYHYLDLSFNECQTLLRAPIHEFRMSALEILVARYEKSENGDKKKIFNLYLKNKKYINNWDLVDTSALYIVGEYLENRNKDILTKLACSKNIWDRRIAIVSTFAYIKKHSFSETFRIAELLMNDSHDLIHKAVGWMLREVGKRSHKDEVSFLKKHYKHMPRTMLRYALEHFSPKEKAFFMSK